MKHNKFVKAAILFSAIILLQNFAHAQTRTASVKINDQVTYQKITGFGGFVNSPQFGYNHMTTAEIRKIWGENSELKYNIMRLYIPIGSTTNPESSWQQVISTAKLGKELGLIVFASPWSMPPAWKTNNNIQNGSLKKEHYGDYAEYLNKFVVFLRKNGVELDAISIQNEPDWDVGYAGCRWTPAEMVEFLKEHRSKISCKVMAPETVPFSSDSYVNALNADDVFDLFDVYAGHQYGNNHNPGTAHKKLAAKGKEIWQSEYLINWVPDGTPANDTKYNFSWSRDAFDFTKAINDCMLADVNAWVHYAAKRYYGMLGDNTRGTKTGEITKRGYILAHYAKYTTGSTRIEHVFGGQFSTLSGSAYLSETGDKVIMMVINNSATYDYSLTVNLPFLASSGICVTTTEAADMNMKETVIDMEETSSPKVNIGVSSVTTLVFTKSGANAIGEIKNMPTVLSEEYYTIMGQKVSPEKNNLKGIYVVKSLMSDGSVSSRKILIP
ncbi:MAG: hypothetical protein LBI82_09040 [Dysgonamonadaceae bacterium]|jgi:glucuronoarabinoxylan endo-1,4-beta-xylanase|nr:hypothetical protein [Dysgonamonadaceae bacterium]